MSRPASGIGLASTAVAALVLIAACADRSPATGPATDPATGPATGGLDSRLVGVWHPLTVVRQGRPTLHADVQTVSSIVFHASGRMVPNGSACMASQVSGEGGRLLVRLPNPGAYCSIAEMGSPEDVRVAGAVERLTHDRRIGYSVSGHTLTLTADGVTVTLDRGPAPSGPPTAARSAYPMTQSPS